MELKHCPFCGGEAEHEYVVSGRRPYIRLAKIKCKTCGCGTKVFPLEDRYGNELPNGESDAEDAWNRRANDDKN